MENTKQIEEMANDLYTCHDEYARDGDDWVTDYNSTAKNLYNKGYRKASDVAREIFQELESCMSCFEDDDDGYLLKKCEFEFFIRELKKKYTDINQRKEDEGK